MIQNNFSWKIGGEAGYGILSAGAMFARAMLRAGLYVFDYAEYPSLIRGGHNTFEVSVSDRKVFAPRRPIQVLIALNQDTVNLHTHELAPDAAVLYNTNNASVPGGYYGDGVTVIGVPFEDLALASGAERVARNVVALGATYALLKLPIEGLFAIIELNFTLKKKPQAIIDTNKAAARAGFDFINKNLSKPFNYTAKPLSNPERMIMAGNNAIALGAIKAGCKFLSGYPMTPATSIMNTLAGQAQKHNLVVVQVEDEIAAICAAIGAGYAGVRSMTVTSGGGFDLMTEAWGMAGQIEVPLVVVEAMRTGPSTGMPTWSGQDDLAMLLAASHGEFPRIVMAPGDLEQCYFMTQEAFNLAEKYQTPVMVITDKYLASSHSWIEQSGFKDLPIDRGRVAAEKDLPVGTAYKRYLHTKDGVSPRTLPGTPGGEHIANSDEHDEESFSDETAEERAKMVDKRFRKFDAAAADVPLPVLEGDSNADITIIGWGSTRGAILEAIEQLKSHRIRANYLQIKYISPFPVEYVKSVFKKAKKIAVVENNKTGQLAAWIREQTGLAPDYKILKYDGRPFFSDEITSTIKNLL
ncbi:MAG: 2-oxoacid:acceptor oxidoreductase subunit alpha [Patescibacteria group bacterium]|nr:2-oxoacid:acceptor oxidoreductase subunit alpha [Patescibacteria group bacterium]MDD5715187.1 2-oxoacid:acceptor oxidoreductase subunit alpha [Patescibacteria group bacterium]